MTGPAVLRFLLQSLFPLVLALLGWGLDDLGGFLANPARLTFLALVLIGGAISVLVGGAAQPFRKGEQSVGRQGWLVALITLVQLVLILFLAFGDRRGLLVLPRLESIRYIGLALAILGGIVRGVAVHTLGKQFSAYVTLQKDHELVQAGIYGVVRHPIYLGFLLTLPGTALVFRSWLVIPAFLLTCFFAAFRIPQEEKLLQENFGEQFEAYRRRTWRLIPRVY